MITNVHCKVFSKDIKESLDTIVHNILEKKVSLDELYLKNIEYEEIKNWGFAENHIVENHFGHIQKVINSISKADSILITYKEKNGKNGLGFVVTFKYNISHYFKLFFSIKKDDIIFFVGGEIEPTRGVINDCDMP